VIRKWIHKTWNLLEEGKTETGGKEKRELKQGQPVWNDLQLKSGKYRSAKNRVFEQILRYKFQNAFLKW